MKALIGKDERITFEEASLLREKQVTELLFDICGMVDEATDDEEERANAKVNISRKLGGAIEAARLEGILTDVDGYLQSLRKYTPEVRIEEVDADER